MEIKKVVLAQGETADHGYGCGCKCCNKGTGLVYSVSLTRAGTDNPFRVVYGPTVEVAFQTARYICQRDEWIEVSKEETMKLKTKELFPLPSTRVVLAECDRDYHGGCDCGDCNSNGIAYGVSITEVGKEEPIGIVYAPSEATALLNAHITCEIRGWVEVNAKETENKEKTIMAETTGNKIYILERKDGRNFIAQVSQFVVEAKSSQEARKMANDHCGEEGYGDIKDFWLNPEYTTCLELKPTGKSRIIVRDYVEEG
jgi:hypothetical protein